MSLSEPRGSSVPSNNNHPQSAFGWSEFWDDGKWKRENNFGCLIDREKRVSFDGTQVFSPLAHQKSIFPNPRENKEEEYVKCEIT